MKPEDYIKKLNLTAHPEGGYFKETYRGYKVLDTERGKRNSATLIYFLLDSGNYSRFHRIAFEEIWMFHAGAPLHIHLIHNDGTLETRELSLEANPQVIIPPHTIFGAETTGDFSLASCMVSPGFDFKDFELFSKDYMLKVFPQQKEVIERLHSNEV